MKSPKKSFKFGFYNFLAVIFLIMLFVAYDSSLADFEPGETLDPECVPGASGCVVAISGGSITYPSAGIVVSTGSAWGTSITDNSSNWNTAYGWGNHALAGYVTGTPWTSMGYVTGTPWTSMGYVTGTPWTSMGYLTSTPVTVVNSSNLFSTGLTGAGSGVTTTTNSIFLGTNAGNSATNASNSNFFGIAAGDTATNASNSNFIGGNAGSNAINASFSTFIGSAVGFNATNASNSIFIGNQAGVIDGVDNTASPHNWSILLGYNTTTGGFSNSILLGGASSGTPIQNTKANQFMLAPSITELRWRDVDYTLPSAQGGASTVLTNNGSGVLSWGAVSGGLSSTADFNTLGGTEAGLNLPSGAQNNSFYGYQAGRGGTMTNAADNNTGIGSDALYGLTTGSRNIAIGYRSLYSNTSGGSNISVGFESLRNNTLGVQNTASGHQSLYSNTVGSNNTAIGYISLFSNITGSYNTALGYQSGRFIADGSTGRTTGDYGLYLGTNTKASADGTTNEIVIGYDAIGQGSNTIQLGNTSILRTYAKGLNLGAGTATAGTAPLKFTSGTNLTTAEAGAMEWDGTNLFITQTSGPTRKTIAYTSDIVASPITVVNTSNLFSTGLTGTGSGVTTATYSNFFGAGAGGSATSASYSNFLGQYAGQGATNAAFSNFMGNEAGRSTNADNSNFFGYQTGQSASNASNSNFLGRQSGKSATNAWNSNFFGQNSGINASAASNSNFIGYEAGSGATSGSYSNFIGDLAGKNATEASNSNFIGRIAGIGAWNASYSNFIGYAAGNSADAQYSNFIGYQAGDHGAPYSNFFGYNAGNSAYDANSSNFIGTSAGDHASFATNSNFIGYQSGYNATNSESSNFLGLNSGTNAANAANSIFIGSWSGYGDEVDNTAYYDEDVDFANTSILIGHKTITGGFSNSIALGAYAANTASNQFVVGSTNRPINTTIWKGASGDCTLTTGTGLTCTSDERLKDDIRDLSSDTLDKLIKVRTINFNWKKGDTDRENIGFLAQDLEQYFPELVDTDKDGYKSVYYANMTPILTESIRELDLKVETLKSFDTDNSNSLGSLVREFLADASNTISDLYAKVIHSDRIETKTLCVGDTCVTEEQFIEMVNKSTDSSSNGGNTGGASLDGNTDSSITDGEVVDTIIEDANSETTDNATVDGIEEKGHIEEANGNIDISENDQQVETREEPSATSSSDAVSSL